MYEIYLHGLTNIVTDINNSSSCNSIVDVIIGLNCSEWSVIQDCFCDPISLAIFFQIKKK